MRGKRIAALLLALAMSMSLLCGSAWAAEPEESAPQTMSANVVESGTFVNGTAFWTLDDAGTLNISGYGSTKYDWQFRYYLTEEKVKKIVIQPGITDIYDDFCSNMFDEGINPNSVQIPGTVTSIGEKAFEGCDALTAITIPNSVTRIGDRAFHCSGLTSVTIPNSVTDLGYGVFDCCFHLSHADLPDNMTSIPAYFFNGCKTLSKITIPDSVTEIQESAFFSSGLTEVTIPNSVTSMGRGVFYHCPDLRKVSLSHELTKIPDSTFYECEKLRDIVIPDSVTSIGQSAFYKCDNLVELEIPDSVTSYGEGAFQGCAGLTQIHLSKNAEILPRAFLGGCTNLSTLTIPEGVRTLHLSSVNSCRNLLSVSIPASVTEIPDHAFQQCDKLNTIYGTPGSAAEKKYQSYKGYVSSDSKENYIDGATIDFYYSASDGTRKNHWFGYSDNMFYANENQIRYSGNLARASLAAAMCGYTDVRANLTDDMYRARLHEADYARAANIHQLFGYLKFSDPRSYNYHVPLYDGSDKVAFTIAHKYLNAAEDINDTSKGEEDTVVAIVIRGGGYGAEWASNFSIVNGIDYDTDHAAFRAAAAEVEDQVTNYVKELKAKKGGIRGNLKIWITGYSRGSAVANKVAHDFNQYGVSGVIIQPGDMYAYTFATPNVGNRGMGALKADISYRTYSKDADIFNIVSPCDIVPKAPLFDWGYGRYGRTLYLPTDNYNSLWSRYTDLSGKKVKQNERISSNQPITINLIEEFVKKVSPDRVVYRTVFQNAIWQNRYVVNQHLAKNGSGEAEGVLDAVIDELGKYATAETLITMNMSGPTLIAMLKNEVPNIGRAHEPEHYFARLELDNLSDIADFSRSMPRKRVVFQDARDLNNIKVNVFSNGKIVGKMENGAITTDSTVTCNSDGTVQSRNRTANITTVGGVCYIDLYDENCSVEVTSDQDETISYESQTLDENMEPAKTEARSDLKLGAGDTLTFNRDETEIIPIEIEKEEQYIYSSSYKKTLGDKSFYLYAENDGDGALHFKSSNTKVATISKTGGKVTIKGVGKTTITITALETDSFLKTTRKVTITVRPKKPGFSGVKNGKGKKAKVSWKTVKGVTGYQIQYGTKKNFKGAKTVTVKGAKKTSCTISKLQKKKKYYMRLRTYQTVSKVKYSSKWTGYKTVTIKK